MLLLVISYPNGKIMRIYGLKTAKEFLDSIKGQGDFTTEELMHIYAEDVAKAFDAECVNEALGNKPMEASNALYIAIDKKYQSIVCG